MNSIYKYILIIMISYPAAQCDYDIGDSNDDNYLNVIDVVSGKVPTPGKSKVI